MNKILFQGAEAIIYDKGKTILKDRISKSYRYPVLDEKIRKQRTKKEARLLDKASKVINVPKVLEKKDYSLVLEKIKGKKLSDYLNKAKNKTAIVKLIGESLAKIHDAGIIHGDLTTSNIILDKDKIYLIDFGLGFESQKIEDKAVDLHVLKEALEAKHYKFSKEAWNDIISSYRSKSKNAKIVLNRLEFVENRGRYKANY